MPPPEETQPLHYEPCPNQCGYQRVTDAAGLSACPHCDATPTEPIGAPPPQLGDDEP